MEGGIRVCLMCALKSFEVVQNSIYSVFYFKTYHYHFIVSSISFLKIHQKYSLPKKVCLLIFKTSVTLNSMKLGNYVTIWLSFIEKLCIFFGTGGIVFKCLAFNKHVFVICLPRKTRPMHVFTQTNMRLLSFPNCDTHNPNATSSYSFSFFTPIEYACVISLFTFVLCALENLKLGNLWKLTF